MNRIFIPRQDRPRAGLQRWSWAAALLFVTASFALAHDTWVSPSTYSVAVGTPVTFDLTSGMEFPALETGPKPNRIAKAGFRTGSEKGELKGLNGLKESLRGTLSFSHAGVATVWFEALPKQLDLTDKDVAEYLEEIHAPPEVNERWQDAKSQGKWQETYIKCAKTFVAVGDPAGDETWKEPVGLALEMVPQTNPATVKAGGNFSVILLRDGKAVPKASIALIAEGKDKRIFQVTDDNGSASFKPEKAGKYLLTCVLLEPTDKGTIWKSKFSTLTFEVK